MDVLGGTKDVTCLWLILWAVAPVNGQKGGQWCDEGWFGPHCEMLCHCARDLACNMDGSCATNDHCMDGYFGPGCQYVNLLSEEGSSKTPNFLTDNDDNTCNPDNSATSVTIVLNSDFMFTWLRLRFHDEIMQLEELNLGTDGHEDGCPTMKWTRVDTTVDITCNSNMLVNTIIIKEPLASRLCSAYFSGGRNVAVKQNVTMSSITADSFEEFSVDGYKDNSTIVQDGFCSQTDEKLPPATWKLMFRIPYIIYRVQVYTTAEYPYTLAGLTLTTYSSSGIVVENLTTADSVRETMLSAKMTSNLPVMYVRLTAGNVYGVTDGNLTLCEVETYGVAPCEKGRHGFACDKICNCGPHELCFALTGGCMSGCRPGLYGTECDKQCSHSCLNNTCSAGTGICYKCTEGRLGDMCNETCPKGRFGADCAKSCSTQCADGHCNYITGVCEKCPIGRMGPECTACPVGEFGNMCSEKCPVRCNKNKCDPVSGACYSCVANYTGHTCSECIVGRYGRKCENTCTPNCDKRICNSSTGACVSCATGFHGPKCVADFKQDETNTALLVFPAFAIFPIIFGIVALCLTKRRKRPRLSAADTHDMASVSSSIDE